jgi:uncharacterized membrane protein YcaP (DUF421 family)
MDTVIRSLVVYVFLLVLFRVAGRRTLSETSNFEFVLLLIISETTQQAMIDSDHSITNAFVSITTLVGISIVLSVVKERFPILERWMEGTPIIIIENGRLYRDRMRWVRVDQDDILSVARQQHGLERMDQIKHVIIENGEQISIIPR